MAVMSKERKNLQRKLVDKFGYKTCGKNGNAYLFKIVETEREIKEFKITMDRYSFMYRFGIRDHKEQVRLSMYVKDKTTLMGHLAVMRLSFDELMLIGEIVGAFKKEYNETWEESNRQYHYLKTQNRKV